MVLDQAQIAVIYEDVSNINQNIKRCLLLINDQSSSKALRQKVALKELQDAIAEIERIELKELQQAIN